MPVIRVDMSVACATFPIKHFLNTIFSYLNRDFSVPKSLFTFLKAYIVFGGYRISISLCVCKLSRHQGCAST